MTTDLEYDLKDDPAAAKLVAHFRRDPGISLSTASVEELTGLPYGTVHHNLEAAIEAGWVKKEKDPRDGRRWLYSAGTLMMQQATVPAAACKAKVTAPNSVFALGGTPMAPVDQDESIGDEEDLPACAEPAPAPAPTPAARSAWPLLNETAPTLPPVQHELGLLEAQLATLDVAAAQFLDRLGAVLEPAGVEDDIAEPSAMPASPIAQRIAITRWKLGALSNRLQSALGRLEV